MYTFMDNWYGDIYEYRTKREAEREAKKHTNGHCVHIYKNGEIVSVIRPNENPLP